jgi:DNA invertase Pin-like site-specific DNA recombinase
VTAAVKTIGYLRASTGDQGQSGLGLRAQEASIRAACQRRGWNLAQTREEVTSGSRADNRPVLSEVLHALRCGEADAVVVAKLDRLSRSVVDAGRLLEQARKRGFNLVALDLGLDLSTPTGELVANVLAAVAQWERRMIGVRTSEALQIKMKTGWASPSWEQRIPKPVRRRIIRMAKAGLSQRQIADRLNRDGVPAIGTQWHRSTIIRVLHQHATSSRHT